jgi:hypothetical protein
LDSADPEFSRGILPGFRATGAPPIAGFSVTARRLPPREWARAGRAWRTIYG